MQQIAAGVDRRQFLVNKLSAGFAMAVLPVSAQTITTDADTLEARDVSLPMADGRIPAYRAMPKSGKSFRELQPKNPIDIAGSLKAPVLGLYGRKDQVIPLDTMEQMRAALKAAGNPAEIVVYPEAGPGFNADYRPGYNQDAAQDGWKRLRQWFKKYGAV